MADKAEAKPVKESKYDDWQVDDALRTILRAEEIQKDKKLMDLVAAKAKEQKEALDKIEARKEILYGDKKDE
jgi:hypothetical protein